MWASAQRDGRPAEYRWRRVQHRLADAHVLECRAVIRCQDAKSVEICHGVPQTPERISAFGGPKFTIM